MNKNRRQKETLQIGDLVRVDVMEWNPNWAINGALGFIRGITPLEGGDDMIQYTITLARSGIINPVILYRFELDLIA